LFLLSAVAEAVLVEWVSAAQKQAWRNQAGLIAQRSRKTKLIFGCFAGAREQASVLVLQRAGQAPPLQDDTGVRGGLAGLRVNGGWDIYGGLSLGETLLRGAKDSCGEEED